MNWKDLLFWFAFFTMVVLAAWIRLYGLGVTYDHPDDRTRLLYRPMHGDEAVQAVKLGQLMETGTFDYDPSDLHGPGLIYSTLPPAWWRGETTLAKLTEATLRTTTALYGAGLIVLLGCFVRAMGRPAVLAGGMLVAMSPIMVFYSRYYIMEIPMVFWITVAMLALWRYGRRPGYAWAIVFGVAGGVTHATKETGAISFFTMAVTVGLLAIVHGKNGLAIHGMAVEKMGRRHGLVAIVSGIVVSMAMYSVCFQNLQSIADSYRTYFLYFQRAAGAGGHEKEWWYYLKTLLWNRNPAGGPAWSELLLLLFGAVGLAAAFGRESVRGGNVLWWRFIAIQTVLTSLIYALIPYKTPWSMLCWVFTLAILAGYGFAFICRCSKPYFVGPVLASCILLAGLYLNGKQIDNSIRRFRADYRNPFAYAHTSAHLLQLVRNVRAMAAVHPRGKGMRVAIYHDEWGWPLPWYLRDFTNLVFSDTVPENPDSLRRAAVIIVPYAYDHLVEDTVRDTHQFETLYGFRDDLKVVVYVENALYERFLDSL